MNSYPIDTEIKIMLRSGETTTMANVKKGLGIAKGFTAANKQSSFWVVSHVASGYALLPERYHCKTKAEAVFIREALLGMSVNWTAAQREVMQATSGPEVQDVVNEALDTWRIDQAEAKAARPAKVKPADILLGLEIRKYAGARDMTWEVRAVACNVAVAWMLTRAQAQELRRRLLDASIDWSRVDPASYTDDEKRRMLKIIQEVKGE